MTARLRIYALCVYTLLTFVCPYLQAQSPSDALVKMIRGDATLRSGQIINSKSILSMGRESVAAFEALEISFRRSLHEIYLKRWPLRLQDAIASQNAAELQNVTEMFFRSPEFAVVAQQLPDYLRDLESQRMLLLREISTMKNWSDQFGDIQNKNPLEQTLFGLLSSRIQQLSERIDLMSDTRILLNQMLTGKSSLPYWWYLYPQAMNRHNYSAAVRLLVSAKEQDGQRIFREFISKRAFDFSRDRDHDGIEDARDKWIDADRDLLHERTADPMVYRENPYDRTTDPGVDANQDGIKDRFVTKVDLDHDGIDDIFDPNVAVHEYTNFPTN